MKTIHVSYHRDGDHLVIGEQPWLVRLIEAVFGAMPGWLVAGRIPFGWRVWNAVLLWCDSHDQPVLELPVRHGCDVAEALWPNRDRPCWHDDEKRRVAHVALAETWCEACGGPCRDESDWSDEEPTP